MNTELRSIVQMEAPRIFRLASQTAFSTRLPRNCNATEEVAGRTQMTIIHPAEDAQVTG
jgi:hypothetical protein